MQIRSDVARASCPGPTRTVAPAYQPVLQPRSSCAHTPAPSHPLNLRRSPQSANHPLRSPAATHPRSVQNEANSRATPARPAAYTSRYSEFIAHRPSFIASPLPTPAKVQNEPNSAATLMQASSCIRALLQNLRFHSSRPFAKESLRVLRASAVHPPPPKVQNGANSLPTLDPAAASIRPHPRLSSAHPSLSLAPSLAPSSLLTQPIGAINMA